MLNFKSFLFATLLVLGSLNGKIIESNEISTILPFVEKDALLLFNLSDVLYEHTSAVAEAQFREYFKERAEGLIPDVEKRAQVVNKIRGLLVTKLPQKNVEAIIPHLIADFQNQQIPVLGITQKRITTPYAENFAKITSQYLLDLGIQLERTLTFAKFQDCQYSDHYTFIYGVIFTGSKPVGPALSSFLKENHYFPKHVILVDNARESLEDAENSMGKLGIDFIGVRYSATDERKRKFDLDLAIIEFFALIQEERVMMDDEARSIKAAQPEMNHLELLDQYIKSS